MYLPVIINIPVTDWAKFQHEQSVQAERKACKIKKGRNRNSALFKIQYPMKNRGKNNRHLLLLQAFEQINFVVIRKGL
jgi:hypothetical protein